MNDIISTQDIRTKVREHVINVFAALIPPEKFDEMIEAEIKEFFSTGVAYMAKRVDSGGWGSQPQYELKTLVTPFRQIVWEAALPLVVGRVDAFLKDPERKLDLDKFIEELFAQPNIQEIGVLNVQQMLLSMVATLFQERAFAAKAEVRESIVRALQNSGYSDLANAFIGMDIETVKN